MYLGEHKINKKKEKKNIAVTSHNDVKCNTISKLLYDILDRQDANEDKFMIITKQCTMVSDNYGMIVIQETEIMHPHIYDI